MILNNVTLLIAGELVKRDIYFEDKIHYIKKDLSKGKDCTGLFLMPGLTNAHVHLGSRSVAGAGLGMKKYEYFDAIGFESHKRRTKEDLYKASLLACLESLKNGVTHIDTMDVDPEPVIKALKKTGLSYTACLPLKDNHLEAGDLEQDFKKTLKLKKEYGNKILLGLANEFECTPQLIRQGLSFAREHDLAIHTHACETIEEVKHMRELTGKRTIQYFNDIGMLAHDVRIAHCTYADTKDILYLSENNVPILHCPTSNEAISDNLPPIRDMIRNNNIISLGTDSFAWNPNASILKEAWRSHELKDAPIEEVYKMTHQPLSKGVEASFSLIDINKLKPFNSTSEFLAKLMNINAIKNVYLKGKKVIEKGKNYLGINESKLTKDVDNIKKKLLK